MNIVIDFLHFNKMGYVKVISYDGFEDLHIWSLLGVESTAHLTFRQTFLLHALNIISWFAQRWEVWWFLFS